MNELIEYLRWKMIDLAEERGSLTHPEVVAVSEQLDDYIVKAQRVWRSVNHHEKLPDRSNVASTDLRCRNWLMDFVECHDSTLRQTASPPF